MNRITFRRATLILCSLVAVFAFASSGFALERIDDNTFPTFQKIHLNLNADSADYTGVVTVNITVKSATKTFNFHAESMELGKTTLTQGGKTFPVTAVTDSTNKGLTTVTSESELSAGDYVLTVEFSDNFDTQANSLYRLDVNDAGYSFTQFEADEAREAFPCWDEPLYKIPWEMTLTVPEHHEAIFNTPFEKETFANGEKTVLFTKTPPMPSYLLAIATGTLEYTEIPGMSIPGRVVCVKGKSEMTAYAVETTPPILKALEKYFDSEYPYKKLDLIAVPEFWAGAMENPGAITYRETLLLIDPSQMSSSQKRRLVAVSAHELAHIWFGDLVTMEWWDDLWLNESFASWMGDKIADQTYPEFEILQRTTRSTSGAMSGDARPSAEAIHREVDDPDLMNIGSLYTKGQAALMMIEEWLGEEDFRNGVLKYIKANEWGNAVADDLWAGLSEASGKDVGAIMGSFIDIAGVPLVEVDMSLDGAVTLTQSRFSNYGVTVPQNATWSIPVEIKYMDGSGVHSASTLLTEKTQTMQLESDGPVSWALPNPGTRGYYRWKTSDEALAAIANDAPEHLSAQERIGYLGNLAALLDAGEVSGGDYLRSLASFANDEDPSVISSLMGGLRKVDGSFVTDDMSDQFAALVRQTLSPALERFGMEPKEGESETTSSLRPGLIGTLADEGQVESVAAHCDQLAKNYLKDPSSVDPAMIGTAIAISATRGDRALYDEYKALFESAQKPADRSRYLGALASFRDKEIWNDALMYTFSGKLRPQEFFTIPGSIAGNSEESANFIFQWLQDNYETVTSQIPPNFKAFLVFFAGGCSKARLATAYEFFMEEAHYAEGMDKRLQRLSDQVNDCVSLREREGAAVAAYLNELSAKSN